MKNKILQADFSARFFRIIIEIQRFCIHWFYTLWNRMNLKVMGVCLGNHVSFNGPITIDRFKYSQIVIGNHCIFNSHYLFNARGIGRCILQTSTDCARIEIGEGTGMSGVSIVANNSVIIGKNVMIGANTKIGDRDDHSELLGTVDAPVYIEDNVFIGMNCLILKGVTIGENSVIGAGSVVTKNIPANSVAAGNPCKVIRQK